jgi:hypothetical protein
MSSGNVSAIYLSLFPPKKNPKMETLPHSKWASGKFCDGVQGVETLGKVHQTYQRESRCFRLYANIESTQSLLNPFKVDCVPANCQHFKFCMIHIAYIEYNRHVYIRYIYILIYVYIHIYIYIHIFIYCISAAKPVYNICSIPRVQRPIYPVLSSSIIS